MSMLAVTENEQFLSNESLRVYVFADNTRVSVSSPIANIIHPDGSRVITRLGGESVDVDANWLAYFSDGEFDIEHDLFTLSGNGKWASLTGRNKNRRYWFESHGGVQITVNNIAKLFLFKFGEHLLFTEDNKIYFIKPLWQVMSEIK